MRIVLKSTQNRRIGLLMLILAWLTIAVGKLCRLEGGADRFLTIGLGSLAIITVLALTLGMVIWQLKRRFRGVSARIGRPVMMAMHDSGSGLDQLLSHDSPYKIPPFPGVSWTDETLEIWGAATDTQPIATIPKATILSTHIDRMQAVLPRPAIQLQINGLIRPICLVLYGPSPLDVMPMGKSRLRDATKEIGLQLPSAEGVGDPS